MATNDYTRLIAERDSRATVAMDMARGYLRPGDWNRDDMALRRLAYAVRQYDHVDAALDRHFEKGVLMNVRYGPATLPATSAKGA